MPSRRLTSFGLFAVLWACSSEFHADSARGAAQLPPTTGIPSEMLPTLSEGSGGSSTVPATPSPGTTSGAPSSGAGGSLNSGGTAGRGSEHSCTNATVTFVVSTPAENEAYCVTGCGGTWLEITDLEGTPILTEAPCGTLDCENCEPRPCTDVACVSTPLGKDGLEKLWNGSQVLSGSCGANALCQQPSCVAPGRYLVRMCLLRTLAMVSAIGSPLAECIATDQRVCTEPQEFSYPEDTRVTAELPTPEPAPN
jgi:hypothetical protein